MFKRSFQQLQIFSEEKTVKEKTSDFKTLLFNYEKKIRFFIIFIISLLIAYSVGIERGKRLNLTKKGEESISVKTEEIKPIIQNVEEIRPFTPKEERMQGYIIQVATYKKTPYAEREAFNLKKKGFQSFIKRSGDFIVVYVGNFQNKDEAKISLKKLKKYYSDCFIRKL